MKKFWKVVSNLIAQNKAQKAMFKQLVSGLKNSMGEGAAELAAAIQKVIADAEAAEEEINEKDLAEAITKEIESAVAAQVVEIENSLKKSNKSNILASKECFKEFANSIRNSTEKKSAFEDYAAYLKKNGIEGFQFPVAVSEAIQTKWNDNDNLFRAISYRAKTAISLQYTNQDSDDVDVRAKGHKPGADKTGQNIDINKKLLSLQAVYKDLYVDRIILNSIENDTALVAWIVNELYGRLCYEIERAIILGDGRPDNDPDKIQSIEPIGEKTASDAFTTVVAYNEDITLLQNLVRLRDMVEAKGRNVWLFMRRDMITEARETIYAAGGSPMYMTTANLAEVIGVERIEEASYLGRIGDEEPIAVMITPDMYARIGSDIFGEDWTAYVRNQEAYRQEVFIGGGIDGLLSTAVLTQPVQTNPNV